MIKKSNGYLVLLFTTAFLWLGAASPAHAIITKEFYRTFKVVVYGDSFTSGYGLEPDKSYTFALRRMLNEDYRRDRIEVVNAGVTGDTASSAVARLASVIAEKPDIVVVALGATDALSRVDPDITYKALEQILSTLTYNNTYVLLVGFQAPDDANIEYAGRYNAIYPTLAKRYQVGYTRDFFKDVRGTWYNLQYDGIYPSEDGMEQIAKNLHLPVSKMIRKLRSRML